LAQSIGGQVANSAVLISQDFFDSLQVVQLAFAFSFVRSIESPVIPTVLPSTLVSSEPEYTDNGRRVVSRTSDFVLIKRLKPLNVGLYKSRMPVLGMRTGLLRQDTASEVLVFESDLEVDTNTLYLWCRLDQPDAEWFSIMRVPSKLTRTRFESQSAAFEGELPALYVTKDIPVTVSDVTFELPDDKEAMFFSHLDDGSK